MQENTEQSNLVALFQKLHTLKTKMGTVAKTSDNPFFKSKYADLNSHLELVEPLCKELGLVLTQSTAANQLGNFVKTDITDIATSAQVSSTLKLPELTDMQKLGSAITYARRYTLSALLAIQAEDDDAAVATGNVGAKVVKTSASVGPKKQNLVETGKRDF